MHVGLVEVAGHRVWEVGGFGGQAILVVPDLDLVVVITQEVGPVFERRLSLLDTLEFAILPALTSFPAAVAFSRIIRLVTQRSPEQPRTKSCPVERLVQIEDGIETGDRIVVSVES